MNVEMTLIEIIGLKRDLHIFLQSLRKLGCVHIDQLMETHEVSARPLALDREILQEQEELGLLVARLQGLLDTLGCSPMPQGLLLDDNYRLNAQQGVDDLLPKVQALSARSEKLKSELASLPRYEATLRALLPITPPSARLPGNRSIGVLGSREHVGVLEAVGKRILDLTAGQAELVARDVDISTRAMLIVIPKEYTQEIESLLGDEDVSRLRLPTELDEGPPDVILASLHRRLAAIPEELGIVNAMQAELAAEWCQKLTIWRDALLDEQDASNVLSCFGETDLTFVLVGWIPAKDLDHVRKTLQEQTDDTILVQPIPLTRTLCKRAPIILKNPKPAQPFESLVNLLALPRYGHIDPTCLMALFLPIFYGMILGDVGYGLLLLLISLGLSRKFKAGVAHDVLVILAIGAGWSIVFGFLYGEAFGTLGEHLGMHAIWFERDSAEHVAGLLLMTLAVGAVHLTLGLIIGVWEAYKENNRAHLLDRGGMLVGLIGLFFIVAVLTDFLPHGFMTPAIVLLIVGVVLMGVSLGWLGVLMGPIEYIGLIGNLLSYLRIAAIGLASVYLAKVANDIAGMAGNVIIGAIVALLIHALNLVLGAFSPTIHSLRLHYVEFFRKFYEGGGRPYQPFKSRLPLDQER